MELTAAQILEYNAPNAFASARTQSRGFSTSGTSSSNSRLRTSTAEESQRLLSGSIDRMDRIEANLTSLLSLAREGSQARTSEERLTEIHALMRSLSAGIDQIVAGTKFKGEQVLDGRSLRLAGAGAASSIALADMSSTGGLRLAETGDGASVKVWYDDYATWRNQNVGLVGLDIMEARSSEASASTRELENGDYELEVIYGGKDSTLIIRNTDGSERSRAEGVDLGGTGIETVKFDIGIELDIDKKQISQTVDKYDYETLGKPSLFAKLNYQRVSTHNLAGAGEQEPRSATVESASAALTGSDGSTFSLVKAGISAVGTDEKELASGQYRVEIDNRGFESSVFLYTTEGRMIKALDKVDLTKEGDITLDFGNGMNLTVNNDGFEGKGKLTALVKYDQASNPAEDFDFQGYIKRVEGALNIVTAQKSMLEQAGKQVDIAINGTSSSSVTATGSQATAYSLLNSALGASSALSLLSNSTDTSAQLQLTQQMILNSVLNAYGTQANTESGSILSMFSSTAAADTTAYYTSLLA